MPKKSATSRTLRQLPSIFVLSALASACFSVNAQSLQALYESARGFDASYLAAQAMAQSAEFRTEQSKALMRPVFTLSGNAARTRSDPPAGVLNPTGAPVNSTTSSVLLSARQPLYNAPHSVTIDQALKAYDVAQADLMMAEHDLMTRLAQAYFDVLAAEDVFNAAQASEKAIGQQLASAKRAYEVGTATITDAREAQARSDLATAQRLAAENDLRVKRLALDQFVGRAQVRPNGLASPVQLPSIEPTTMESWVELSESKSPGIRRAALALDVAKLETEKARAGHAPTLDLIGSIGPTRTIGSATTSTTGTTTNATIGVQGALPLYQGGVVQNRIKETLLLEEKALNELNGAKRSLAQNARAAYLAVQSGQAQVKALEAAESSTRLALQATQTGYRVGVRVNLDILNAQTQLFQTQRDLALARYNVLLGILRLKQAAGTLSTADLAALDRVLTVSTR